MHATIRRYEGVDATRINEVVGKVNETLVPKLQELPGFTGYYLIEGSGGVSARSVSSRPPSRRMRPRRSLRSGSPTRTSVP